MPVSWHAFDGRVWVKGEEWTCMHACTLGHVVRQVGRVNAQEKRFGIWRAFNALRTPNEWDWYRCGMWEACQWRGTPSMGECWKKKAFHTRKWAKRVVQVWCIRIKVGSCVRATFCIRESEKLDVHGMHGYTKACGTQLWACERPRSFTRACDTPMWVCKTPKGKGLAFEGHASGVARQAKDV
ncbi:hypothetical protein PIB30_037701 [Stylosanthes scabra]|uniref:Uncharacterized protein n=1 Tax=Stylosanthes scabra TaxID=79078 RepID=A0ABU6YE62_9FABA|nr:hypothetical protein [Stylosanthes scabra]